MSEELKKLEKSIANIKKVLTAQDLRIATDKKAKPPKKQPQINR